MSSPELACFIVRRRHLGLMSTFGALALAASLFSNAATAQTLTLGRAQQLAAQRSYALPAKNYAATAAREMAVAAGELPDPVLTAGIENVPVSGSNRFSLTSDFMTMRSIGVMQEVTRSDKRHWRSERYLREANRSEAEKIDVLASIQRNTALAWLERYFAEEVAKVVAEEGDQAKLEVQAAQGQYRAGRGSQAELLGMQSGVTSFDNRLSEAKRQVHNAKVMLARWIGPDGSMPLAGAPELDTLRLNPANLESDLAHHPRIAILSRQVEVAEAEANLAKANKKADWSVGVMFQQREPDFSNMASLRVSIPLQWNQHDRQDRELAAKLAMLEQAKAERDEALRAHVAETQAMVNEWENNRERLARFERELIPLAQQRTQAVVAAYRGGQAALPEVLFARRKEIDVRLEALQLQRDTARLWAELNYLFPDDRLLASSVAKINRDMK